MKKALIMAFVSVLCGMPLLGFATPVPIDLTTFSVDPAGYVTIDGPTSAMMLESPDPTWATRLWNDYLPVPAGSTTLEFGYEVYIDEEGWWCTQAPADHSNAFAAEFYDPVTGSIWGWREIFCSSAGTVSWDIAGAPFVGGTVGLRMYLINEGEPDPDTTDSYARITTGPAPVPEASTLMLFGSGLSGLLFYARKKRLMKF